MFQAKLPTLPRASARTHLVRAVAALALATPAAAVAAEPAAEAVAGAERTAALKSGPENPVSDRISDPLAVAAEQQRAERRKRRAERADGPFHPMPTSVDYGDAQAAFGDARGRPHEGQDIFAPAGTPVVAPAAGVVADGGSDGGRGNWVAIYDPERKQTYSYFHLIEPAAVSTGDEVEAGERVGKVGCTGSCFGDHLHFEVRDGRGPYGTAVDPMPMLERWKPAQG